MAPPYHDHPTYIEPIAEKLKESDEYILFSYHGIPERHLRKADPTGNHCMKCNDCRNVPNPDAHALCYRQQCFATTHAIVQAAGLPDDRWRVTFQSRLGANKFNEWLKPYTDKTLRAMRVKASSALLSSALPFSVTVSNPRRDRGGRQRDFHGSRRRILPHDSLS